MKNPKTQTVVWHSLDVAYGIYDSTHLRVFTVNIILDLKRIVNTHPDLQLLAIL